MKSLIKIPYYLLVASILTMGLLLLATLMPIPGNFKVKIVKSGSMEPTIKTGGIVVIRPTASYMVGDVITFGKDTKTQIPTTHRIIESKGEEGTREFLTKGDANDAPDPVSVKISEIGGKVVFSLPYLGFILDFVKKPLGFVFLVGLPALLVIIDELSKIWQEIKRMRTKKESPKDKIQFREFGHNNVLDLRIKYQINPVSTTHSYSKTLSAFIIVFFSIFGLSSVSSTVSYYNENEVSLANTLQASADYPNAEIENLILGASVENAEEIIEPENQEVAEEKSETVETDEEVVENMVASSTDLIIQTETEQTEVVEPETVVEETVVEEVAPLEPTLES